MNNSGLVKNNQQSYYHLNFYERAPALLPDIHSPAFPFRPHGVGGGGGQ